MNIATHHIAVAVLGVLLLGACSSAPQRSEDTYPTRASDVALSDRASDVALSMLGKPYRYGGNTPNGFDCSGLVQYSYHRAGARLPHGTAALRRQSRPISIHNLQRGDLVFFDQEGKRSSHVGIFVGGDRFVHAPSTGKKVHVAKLAEPYWRKHFVGARRLELD